MASHRRSGVAVGAAAGRRCVPLLHHGKSPPGKRWPTAGQEIEGRHHPHPTLSGSPRHRPRDEREGGRARRRPSVVRPGWVILASRRNPDGRRRREPGERGRRNPRKPRKRPKKPSRRELVRDNGGVPERAAARVRSAVVSTKQLWVVGALRARKGAPRGGWYRRVRRFNNHQGWLSSKGDC
jgi:hypothetical protein